MSSAPVHSMDWKITGNGKTVIREPLYVFAVGDDLTATMTDEVNGFVDWFGFDRYRGQKDD